MTKKKLAIIVIALGILASLVGIASATVFRPPSTVTATIDAPESPLIVVEPGVLPLVAENVTVTARASESDTPVILALAPISDVVAWVGDAKHTTVTGLESWEKLAADTKDGEASAPNPHEAEVWRHVFTGEGEVEVKVTPSGNTALLAATDGTAAAPELSLSWPRIVETPLLIPLLVAGGLIMVGGLALLSYARASAPAEEKEKRSRRAKKDEAEDEEEIDPTADTHEFEMPKGPLTRRQIRELERRRRAADSRHGEGGAIEVTAGSIGAGIVPGVFNPERFRALRYVEIDEDFAKLPDDEAFSSKLSIDFDSDESDETDERLKDSGPSAGAGVVPPRGTSTEPIITAPVDDWMSRPAPAVREFDAGDVPEAGTDGSEMNLSEYTVFDEAHSAESPQSADSADEHGTDETWDGAEDEQLAPEASSPDEVSDAVENSEPEEAEAADASVSDQDEQSSEPGGDADASKSESGPELAAWRTLWGFKRRDGGTK